MPSREPAIAVCSHRLDDYVRLISPPGSLGLIRQMRVDIPRCDVKINGKRISRAEQVFCDLHNQDVRIFPFFQQGALAPAVCKLQRNMGSLLLLDGRRSLSVCCVTCDSDWKVDVHKKMHAYRLREDEIQRVGDVDIMIHATKDRVVETYDIY